MGDRVDSKVFSIREANEADIPAIFRFIKELAEYEELADQVVATEEVLKDWLFVKNKAEVILAELDGEAIGFALFFHNFSTFLGRAGIYLEDLYISSEYRNKGYGKQLFAEVARIAVARDCGRLDWWCLDWNKPSIDFYYSLGAEAMKDWTVYRLSGKKLKEVASLSSNSSMM